MLVFEAFLEMGRFCSADTTGELLWVMFDPLLLTAPGLASVVRARDESGSPVVSRDEPVVRIKLDLDNCKNSQQFYVRF